MLPTMCQHVFIYDGRDKTTNSQTNSSTKYIYISNIRGGGMQNEIYCNYIMINIYFRVCVRIFN